MCGWWSWRPSRLRTWCRTPLLPCSGAANAPGEALIDTLVAYLKTREVLLVLDNCEHLIDACADLAERLLVGCPRVRLLATSRERLRIGAETTWRVPSLPGPDPRATLAPADLLAYPAVQLFVERAQAVQPDFALSPAAASSMAGICARLEGLPLALELAAARVSALSLAQILERLDDSFRLLVGGSRTAPTRQQTLRATLDWSHGLLSVAEQAVFRRLAVFAGGWSLEAAEAVCADPAVPPADVLELLSHLVDKSLVVVDGRRARWAIALPPAGADPSVRSGAVGGQRRAGRDCAATRRVLSWPSRKRSSATRAWAGRDGMLPPTHSRLSTATCRLPPQGIGYTGRGALACDWRGRSSSCGRAACQLAKGARGSKKCWRCLGPRRPHRPEPCRC